MRATDYYTLLGAEPRADVKEIRSAYRALARLHHPDHTGGSSAEMAELNEAWGVLSDAATRAAYDRELAFPPQWPEPVPNVVLPHPAPRRASKGDEDVLDFGRYAGWSLRDLVSRDRDYLLWLKRTSVGRRYAANIDALLRQAPVPIPRASRNGWSH